MKSPLLACGLSALFPGIGQMYNGETTKGLSHAGLFISGMYLMLSADELKFSKGNSVVYLGAGVAAAAYLWSVIDAPISASRINERYQASGAGHSFQLEMGRCILTADIGLQPAGVGAQVRLNF